MNDDIDDAQTLRHAEPLRKAFEITSTNAELKDNSFRGISNVTGIIDRGGDCIYPGAFAKAIPAFLKDGFVPVGHDWAGLPVAMPVSAKEVDNRLEIEAQFHSFPAAQDARTVMVERLEKGMSVGLSIGFRVNEQDYHYFKSGNEMLTHAKGLGVNVDLMDASRIAAYKGSCRGISSVPELFEVSLVTVPMNQRSTATAAKSDNLGTGLEYGDYLELVAAQVKELVERTERRREVRVKQGRKLSVNTAERLSDIYASCETLKSLLEAIYAEQSEEMPTTAEADTASAAIALGALAARAELARLELSRLSLAL